MSKNYREQKNTNGWTQERRQKQAQLIHQWQPWAHSTGAKTPEGKAKAARNAYKGGQWLQLRLLTREVNAELRTQKKWLDQI